MNKLTPTLKSTVSYYFTPGKAFFKTCGNIFEVEDDAGLIQMICTSLSKCKTIDMIFEEIKEKLPTVSINTIKEIIQALDSILFIENSNLSDNSLLTSYEVNRWSRNLDFFGSFCCLEQSKYFFQAKLSKLNVALLGLGGLGSHILMDLLCLGVKNITAVDFDKVEISNLNRQILYDKKDLGRLKTEVAKERVSNFLPEANIKFINKKIESAQCIEPIIQGCDAVICVADKPRRHIQNWLNTACVKYKIPFITGGLDTQRAVFCSIIPGESGCIECWKEKVRHENSVSSSLLQQDQDIDSSDTIPAPAIVTLVSVLTGLMLSEFLKLTLQFAPLQSLGKLMEFDFRTLQITLAENWTRNTNCSVCKSK